MRIKKKIYGRNLYRDSFIPSLFKIKYAENPDIFLRSRIVSSTSLPVVAAYEI